MLETTQMRALPLLNRAADMAPAATGCCNACRSCLTANVAGILAAAFGALVVGSRRIMRRRPPAPPIR